MPSADRKQTSPAINPEATEEMAKYGITRHAAFGGYKKSDIGRENHKMMLDHYQQTKNVLVSYSPKALGFF